MVDCSGKEGTATVRIIDGGRALTLVDCHRNPAAFFRAFRADAPASILKLALLTPGDFAVVARKAEVLGERDANRLARWLADEVAAKPEGRKVKMGF